MKVSFFFGPPYWCSVTSLEADSPPNATAHLRASQIEANAQHSQTLIARAVQRSLACRSRSLFYRSNRPGSALDAGTVPVLDGQQRLPAPTYDGDSTARLLVAPERSSPARWHFAADPLRLDWHVRIEWHANGNRRRKMPLRFPERLVRSVSD